MLAQPEESLWAGLNERRRSLRSLPGLEEHADLVALLRQVDEAIESFPDRMAQNDRQVAEVGRLPGPLGICEACGIAVEESVLEIDPLARLCLECLSEAERRALEDDLNLATRVQTALLPTRHLDTAGWETHFSYRPFGAVSGDYADLVDLDDGGVYFLFGDVSGKGFAASLLMAHLQALFRSLSETEARPGRLLKRLNRALSRSTLASSFATAVAGRLDPSGRLVLANAGHNPPLWLQSGEIRPLGATGLPLGVACDADFASLELDLGAGDLLFLYTDGVSEAVDRNGEEFGAERLGRLLSEGSFDSAQAATRASLDAVGTFSRGVGQIDDVTVMAIRRTD